MAAVAIAEPTQNREWTDASGKHSIEAEFVDAKVTLRLPNGQTKVVDMRSLSDSDRQFIVEQLRKQDAPANPQQQPPKQLPQLIDDLKAALKAGDKARVSAASKSIAAADAKCKDVQPIVDQLLNGRDNKSAAKALWILQNVGTGSDWAVNALWALQGRVANPSRIMHVESGGVDVEISFDNDPLYAESPLNAWFDFAMYSSRRQLMERVWPIEPYREANRLLAEHAATNKQVKELFDKRLEQLKTAPETQVRAKAALGLSRATALSPIAIPALLDTLKNDVSPSVKVAAAVSLAGFGDSAKAAMPAVVDGIDSTEQNETRYILLVALADIDPASGPFRKTIGKLLEEYRRSRDANYWHTLVPACNTLGIMGTKSEWAIPQLLDTATVALQREDESEFNHISMALIAVGGVILAC
jgi:hypothetical protein